MRFLLVCSLLLGLSLQTFGVSVRYLESHYSRGRSLEAVGSFQKARQQYALVLKAFLHQTANHERSSLHQAYALGSAFRLSLTTSKTVYLSLQPVLTEHDYFKQTDDYITGLVHYFSDKKTVLPVSLLYYARGYNRILWSNRLLEAIPWKKFVLYPQSDLILLLDSGISDMQTSIQSGASFLPEPKDSSIDIHAKLGRQFRNQLATLSSEKPGFRAYQLISGGDSPDEIAYYLASQLTYKGFDVIAYRNTFKVNHILKQARTRYTYDSVVSQENKRVFTVFDTFKRLLFN